MNHPIPVNTFSLGFLVLSDDQQSFLNAALVGIIIMIVAEIAVLVLKRVFCSKMKVEDGEALLTGNAKTSDEILAEAKQIVAEAEASVATAAKSEDKTEE